MISIKEAKARKLKDIEYTNPLAVARRKAIEKFQKQVQSRKFQRGVYNVFMRKINDAITEKDLNEVMLKVKVTLKTFEFLVIELYAPNISNSMIVSVSVKNPIDKHLGRHWENDDIHAIEPACRDIVIAELQKLGYDLKREWTFLDPSRYHSVTFLHYNI